MSYTIRELQFKDIYSLHKLYNSLSEQDKRFFHIGFLGTGNINFRWFLAQIALFLSSIRVLRRTLLHFFPSSAFLFLVIINQGKVIGFAFLKIKRRSSNGRFSAELGIVVDETHRGKGLGSKLMENLLKLAQQENVGEVFLTVLSDNMKAIQLYEKYGFKKVGETVDRWKGRTFQSIIMKKVL